MHIQADAQWTHQQGDARITGPGEGQFMQQDRFEFLGTRRVTQGWRKEYGQSPDEHTLRSFLISHFSERFGVVVSRLLITALRTWHRSDKIGIPAAGMSATTRAI
jgi:hypothetical protein